MNSACSEKLFNPNWQWQANLHLTLENNQRGTRLKRNRHQGPLYVQKPFYPEDKDCAHIYLLHPPGGLVSGDSLVIDIELDQKAHSVITTPGAARLYKARQSLSEQQQHTKLKLAEGAILEWFPMEAIVYPGASAELKTTIELSEQSRFIGWEISCFGLPASNDAFSTGSFDQRYVIEQNGLPVFIDKLQLNTDNTDLFHSPAGLQSKPVSGFFIAGPFKDKKDSQLSEKLRAEVIGAGMEGTVTITWIHHFCIARYLGHSAYTCRQSFSRLWHLIRPALIDRKACEPRIWLT